MSHLAHEISVYEKHETEFRKTNDQDWVIISGDEILGFFSSFESASRQLRREFNPNEPDRPFLVRRINRPIPVLNGFKYA